MNESEWEQRVLDRLGQLSVTSAEAIPAAREAVRALLAQADPNAIEVDTISLELCLGAAGGKSRNWLRSHLRDSMCTGVRSEQPAA